MSIVLNPTFTLENIQGTEVSRLGKNVRYAVLSVNGSQEEPKFNGLSRASIGYLGSWAQLLYSTKGGKYAFPHRYYHTRRGKDGEDLVKDYGMVHISYPFINALDPAGKLPTIWVMDDEYAFAAKHTMGWLCVGKDFERLYGYDPTIKPKDDTDFAVSKARDHTYAKLFLHRNMAEFLGGRPIRVQLSWDTGSRKPGEEGGPWDILPYAETILGNARKGAEAAYAEYCKMVSEKQTQAEVQGNGKLSQAGKETISNNFVGKGGEQELIIPICDGGEVNLFTLPGRSYGVIAKNGTRLADDVYWNPFAERSKAEWVGYIEGGASIVIPEDMKADLLS